MACDQEQTINRQKAKLDDYAAKSVVPLQAKKFTYRYSDPCMPIENRKQDRHFPAKEKLDYNNYLVAVN